jgi:hypothetical protein
VPSLSSLTLPNSYLEKRTINLHVAQAAFHCIQLSAAVILYLGMNQQTDLRN